MSAPDPATVTLVVFEVERAWIADVEAALAAAAAGNDLALGRALERWWAWRQDRLAAATVPLADPERHALASALAPEPLLAELAAGLPATVRWSALARLRDHVRVLGGLVETAAPELIVSQQRTRVAEDLAVIDPAVAWVAEPTPALATVADAAGAEVPNLHAWMEHMVRAAWADASITDRVVAVAAGPAAAADADADAGPAAAADADAPAPPPLAPGGEWTCYAHQPRAAFWHAPATTLPHRLDLPAGPTAGPRRVVVGIGGSPVTFVVAGDQAGPAIAPTLAARIDAVAADRAVIAFVWLETDVSAPWDRP